VKQILASVTALALFAAPTVRADVAHQPLNALGDHIQITGVSQKQIFTYDFQLNSFETRRGRLFAVGTLSGGNLPSAQQVALPIGANRDNRGRDGRDDDRGGFGALQGTAPASPALYRGSAQPGLIQQTVYQSTASPSFVLAQATQTCQILNLNIQPLHLNLLGLVVDLQAVILDITAVAGAGNLLGNLLCAVVGLLDNVG
jgi:hypothetical protein